MAVDLNAHKTCPTTVLVEVGKGKSAYKVKYAFCRHRQNQAVFYYKSLNTHSGHKKRLVINGKVTARVIT